MMVNHAGYNEEPQSISDEDARRFCCYFYSAVGTVATLITAGVISLLVCGILGQLGKLPMAPTGGLTMTLIGVAAIVGLAVIAVRHCSCN